ncbi:Hypothetical predicted protein [Marmota monax]|uniref:Rrp7 RRM-like N-terminal domain-containing protein n=1 Tax=Marmota monax TaxID=9995 RepID=A0A5E4BLU5_MARMO|nr:Hypothetical predicted protein [Marmota monax]
MSSLPHPLGSPPSADVRAHAQRWWGSAQRLGSLKEECAVDRRPRKGRGERELGGLGAHLHSRQPDPDSHATISLPAIPIKFSAKQRASHYLYVREHRVREGTQSTWPQKRTLFVINVPPYCNEECLTRLLSPCGTVQSVELQEKPDLAESAKEPKSKFFHPMPIPAPWAPCLLLPEVESSSGQGLVSRSTMPSMFSQVPGPDAFSQHRGV